MIKRLGYLAFALLVAIVAGSTIISCQDQERKGKAEQVQVYVKDYGNGVLYFHSSGEEFGREFSAWRAQHPKWIIIAVAADNSTYGGYTTGYFVIANQDL